MSPRRLERVELGAGAGVVAAAGDVALFVPDSDAAGPIVAIARDTVAGDPSPGRAVARRLGAYVTGASADVPAFGALVGDGDDWIVVLHGGVAATVVTEDESEHRFAGTDSATWLDRILPVSARTVVIARDGQTPEPTGLASLEAGVVPGGWLRAILPARHAAPPDLLPADLPPPSPARPAVAPPDLATPSRSSSITGGAAILPPPDRRPSSPARAVSPPTRQWPVGEAELFSLSPDGLEPRAPLPIEGVTDPGGGPHAVDGGASATPLGVLVFDDDSTFALDGDYVIGREADTDPDVLGGRARPIVVDDVDGTVSRVHAEVRVTRGDVQLIDRGSTNGTHVWDESARTWVRLEPGTPRVIHPGERGAVGQRMFVYDRPSGLAASTAAPSPERADR